MKSAIGTAFIYTVVFATGTMLGAAGIVIAKDQALLANSCTITNDAYDIVSGR
jgi:hypothetical protein